MKVPWIYTRDGPVAHPEEEAFLYRIVPGPSWMVPGCRSWRGRSKPQKLVVSFSPLFKRGQRGAQTPAEIVRVGRIEMGMRSTIRRKNLMALWGRHLYLHRLPRHWEEATRCTVLLDALGLPREVMAVEEKEELFTEMAAGLIFNDGEGQECEEEEEATQTIN